MSESIVINTGPLISLGRVGAFSIVEQLPIHFITPRQVADEISAGKQANHPVTLPDWVDVITLSAPLNPVVQQTLDAGEAAVIQLALERNLSDVCIDEWRGRRAAKSVGLRVTGSLGLLGRAKNLGLINDVRSWVDRLIEANAHYDSTLIRSFLEAMGELES